MKTTVLIARRLIGSVPVAAVAMASLVSAMLCLTGCAARQPQATVRLPPPKLDLVQLEPGAIWVFGCPDRARVAYDRPSRRLEPASEGAGQAARAVMNTPDLWNRDLEAAVGVLGFAVSPFAAAYGALNASQQRLSPEKLGEAERELAEALRTAASPGTLCQKVREAARQQTHRLLIYADPVAGTPSNAPPVSARLEVAVEQLQLKVANLRQTEFALHMEVRARLLRAPEGGLLFERTYHYQSGAAFFIDWARPRGLAPVAQTGYQALAEQIAEDIFHPVMTPPILIGPGQQRGRTTRHSHAGTPAPPRASCHLSRAPTTAQPRVAAFHPHDGRRLVHTGLRHHARFRQAAAPAQPAPAPAAAEFDLAEPAGFEVRSGTNQPLFIYQRGGDSGAKDATAAEGQTDYALDGLADDRNSVVQVVSCLAAFPSGLWEHTVGAIGRRSRERTDQLASDLRVKVGEVRFEKTLTDDVAYSLQSHTSSPVKRSEAPLRFTLAGIEVRKDASAPAPATRPKTSLEIQVISTRLVGKHRNSRSRALEVEIQATVIRTSDGQELCTCPVRYRSTPRPLTEWAASDAKLLREELEACSRQAAEALTVELLDRRGFGQRHPP